jgi:hypothetical protein
MKMGRLPIRNKYRKLQMSQTTKLPWQFYKSDL